MSDPRLDATLRTAERVVALLSERGIDTVLIGALALAAHGYPRATEDLDLAVAVEPRSLGEFAARLREEGWHVEVRRPDAADPLGGVIDVRAPDADLVQVVNFDNSPTGGFPRLVREAIADSRPLSGSTLRVASAPALVTFKLYAGGPKSTLDILALLECSDIDLESMRATCADLGLEAELDRVLAQRS